MKAINGRLTYDYTSRCGVKYESEAEFCKLHPKPCARCDELKRAHNRERKAEQRARRREAPMREAQERQREEADATRRPELLALIEERMRAAGGVLQRQSSPGSRYYELPTGFRLRVSDHAIPQTEERRYNAETRGRFGRAADGDIRLTGRGGFLRATDDVLREVDNEIEGALAPTDDG